ncbi:hypothetical protein LSAT2_029038, partial [Lamellibrachia satsuma]
KGKCGAVRNTTAAVTESVRVWDHINDFIRDQVIYSCRLKRLRKKMLDERDLKLERVLHLAERPRMPIERPLTFSLETDVSNKGNRKMFPLAVQFFAPETGVSNKILDFGERR